MAIKFGCPAEKNCMKQERKSAVERILISKRESLVDSSFAHLLGDHSRQANELHLPLGHETAGNFLD